MSQQKLRLAEPRYLLQVEGGGSPTITHHNRDHAISRAIQLCRQTRRRVFIFEPTTCIAPVIEAEVEIPVVESEVEQ